MGFGRNRQLIALLLLACAAGCLSLPPARAVPPELPAAPTESPTTQVKTESVSEPKPQPADVAVLPLAPANDQQAAVGEPSTLVVPPPPVQTEPDIKIDIKPAPLESTDVGFPINLATALRLSDARPLIVAAAQVAAWAAESELQFAQVLWVPSFMMNCVFLRHGGPVDFNHAMNVPAGINALGQPDPTSFGRPLNENFSWFYSGASMYLVVGTTDAIFQPLVARQTLNAARWEIQTAKNDALLTTARAYFNVHKYRGQYAGRLYTVEQARRLVAKLEVLSKDLIPAVEIERGRTLLAYLEAQAASAREDWRRSSADLTQILRLDPRAVVDPLEHDHLQITLVDPGRALDELMPIALRSRPELIAQQALVDKSAVRIRQEKLRPVLPSILVTGWQAPGGMTTEVGIIGTGMNNTLTNWTFREDISLQAVWQLDAMGLGNLAMIKQQRGAQSEAIATLLKMQDQVAAEITEAQADVQSAAVRVLEAERTLQASLFTFEKSLDGLGQTERFGDVLHLVYRPQEVVYALKLLTTAFDEYFTTVAEYNAAQFELFHALGYPAQDLSTLRPPGEILTISTDRPGFLPTVGVGPPPSPR